MLSGMGVDIDYYGKIHVAGIKEKVISEILKSDHC